MRIRPKGRLKVSDFVEGKALKAGSHAGPEGGFSPTADHQTQPRDYNSWMRSLQRHAFGVSA
jgi:hypothetical protein